MTARIFSLLTFICITSGCAAAHSNSGAAAKQQVLEQQLSAEELKLAAVLSSGFEDTCTYEQVFAQRPAGTESGQD